MVELLPLIPMEASGMLVGPARARWFIAELGYHIEPTFLKPGETEEQALARVEALYAAYEPEP